MGFWIDIRLNSTFKPKQIGRFCLNVSLYLESFCILIQYMRVVAIRQKVKL